jgi:pimeloyl-ACP methyl ester carboxylesterase
MRFRGPRIVRSKPAGYCNAFLGHGSYRIRYELDGPAGAPVYVLVNGLTQYAELWTAYRDALLARHFRVATFDMLGQGGSDKPALFINQDDQVAALHGLIGELGDGPVFLSGISFGGLIALRYAIRYGERLSGLVPMSCFAELTPQLLLIGGTAVADRGRLANRVERAVLPGVGDRLAVATHDVLGT